ncbi:MAG: cell division protein ZapD [Rubrivivax sp.]
MVLYEYPFNEGIRTMLRLEQLFDRLGTLIERDAPIDHHFALFTIFEIMDVASRADLKADLLKELERHKGLLQGFRGNPSISEAALDEVVARIDHAHDTLHAVQGKVGQSLAANDWLMGIRSRIAIPGGTCEFDLPGYYAWQQHPAARRRADLQGWVASLVPLAEALGTMLQLLRDSGSPQKMVAQAGQFQQRLPEGRAYNLLRLQLDGDCGLVPEISGHRLMVSVRMMRPDADGRLKPAPEDANFVMTLCS